MPSLELMVVLLDKINTKLTKVRSIDDLEKRYNLLLKRNSYYGDKWFNQFSEYFNDIWDVYPNKNILYKYSNSDIAIAKFVAFYHSTDAIISPPLDSEDTVEEWFNNKIAFLYDSSPFQATRKGSLEKERFKYFLQTGVAPEYNSPYSGVEPYYFRDSEQVSQNNERIKLYNKKAKKVEKLFEARLINTEFYFSSLNYGFDNLHSGVYDNLNVGVIFNGVWEVWETQRFSSWDLVFYTRDIESIYDFIRKNYTCKKIWALLRFVESKYSKNRT